MNKIYYTSDGWVCGRAPQMFEIDDETRFIEVDEEAYNSTFLTASGYAWRVVDGKLINDIYDKSIADRQNACGELSELETWFTEIYDVQVKQYERCQRLGLKYDNKYGTIDELDAEAAKKAKRIKELRVEIEKYTTR